MDVGGSVRLHLCFDHNSEFDPDAVFDKKVISNVTFKCLQKNYIYLIIFGLRAAALIFPLTYDIDIHTTKLFFVGRERVKQSLTCNLMEGHCCMNVITLITSKQ